MEVYIAIRECDVITGNVSILGVYEIKEDAEEYIENLFKGLVNTGNIASEHKVKTYTVK